LQESSGDPHRGARAIVTGDPEGLVNREPHNKPVEFAGKTASYSEPRALLACISGSRTAPADSVQRERWCATCRRSKTDVRVRRKYGVFICVKRQKDQVLIFGISASALGMRRPDIWRILVRRRSSAASEASGGRR